MALSSPQAHAHHYVPQWYQRRFLAAGQDKLWYLDLHPERVLSGAYVHERRDLLHWGPKQCFYQEDLYSLKLGELTSDEIESKFFGKIDSNGLKAVGFFSTYDRYSDQCREAFTSLTEYMDAQRFRTPMGLDHLRGLIGALDKQATLRVIADVFKRHTVMWTEGVWEIARADDSATKFLVTDQPVTFYNRRLFPSEARPKSSELDLVGTRTVFPLGPDSCLLITHLQFTRKPTVKPDLPRENARPYGQTIRNLLDIQFGRQLIEDEVVRINRILKGRATRYVAAADKQWLYPERVSSVKWAELDDDWFLLPNLNKVDFTTSLTYGVGPFVQAQDEYGRSPSDPRFRDKARRDIEWKAYAWAQGEWARRRRGRASARVDAHRV